MIDNSKDLIKKLHDNTKYFRNNITKLGYEIKDGNHPIVPVMLNNAQLAQQVAAEMLKENIYVISFSYPVVPKGQARIRVQISAEHSKKQIDKALDSFRTVGKKLNII